MNPLGISLVVGFGTAIGIWIDYPHARMLGLLIMGLINGTFALLATMVAASALRVFGVLPREDK